MVFHDASTIHPRLSGVSVSGQKRTALRAILDAYPNPILGADLDRAIGCDSAVRRVVVCELRKRLAGTGLTIAGHLSYGYLAKWDELTEADWDAYIARGAELRAAIDAAKVRA